VEAETRRQLKAEIDRRVRAKLRPELELGRRAGHRKEFGPLAEDALRRDPTRSNYAIAKQLGCTPATIANARKRLGLTHGRA
jgi:hypothetical protein